MIIDMLVSSSILVLCNFVTVNVLFEVRILKKKLFNSTHSFNSHYRSSYMVPLTNTSKQLKQKTISVMMIKFGSDKQQHIISYEIQTV